MPKEPFSRPQTHHWIKYLDLGVPPWSPFFVKKITTICDLCGQLQRCQMPDIGKQPKNSRKGCRVGHGKTAEKQPGKQPKHPKNSQDSCFSGVSAVFPAVFRLFYRDPLGTLFGCFSMSGIWHLCKLAAEIANHDFEVSSLKFGVPRDAFG